MRTPLAGPRALSKKKNAPNKPLLAQSTEKFHLYEEAVQCPESDIAFIERIYTSLFKRKPLRLREDFCGSAALCARWVRKDAHAEAWGLDLDKKTLHWSAQHRQAPLQPTQQKRMHLLHQDVLQGLPHSVDVVVAFNFSYCIFKTRELMLRYFLNVRKSIKKSGIFFMDVHGGRESFAEMQERTKKKGFTYVWDQGPYDPISGFAKRSIHFEFRDGSVMHDAFVYHWRLWTLPELRDILYDAGFAHVDVYWEGDDGKGHGNGQFRKVKKATDELAWVSYIVAYGDV